jgi:hypothetical protein
MAPPDVFLDEQVWNERLSPEQKKSQILINRVKTTHSVWVEEIGLFFAYIYVIFFSIYSEEKKQENYYG